jgi:cell division septation protein DedD
MAGRSVALMLTLLALTGLVVFYLGVLTGRGLRDPNDTGASATATPGAVTAGQVATASLPSVQPTALNQALQAPTSQIEGLAKQERAASEQTQQLISRSKQQLALEDVPDKGTSSAKVAAPPAAPAAPTPAAKPIVQTTAKPAPWHPGKPARTSKTRQVPAASSSAPAATDADEGSFTVQVFSSPQQQHAQEILTDLKKKGFPAYMNQFQAADKRTWYRVRVGKGTRAEADALSAQIQNATSNIEPRVLKQ